MLMRSHSILDVSLFAFQFWLLLPSTQMTFQLNYNLRRGLSILYSGQFAY